MRASDQALGVGLKRVFGVARVLEGVDATKQGALGVNDTIGDMARVLQETAESLERMLGVEVSSVVRVSRRT